MSGGATGGGATGGANGAAAAGGATARAATAGRGALRGMTRGVLPAHDHEAPSTGGEIDYLRTAWGTDHLAPGADAHPEYATDAGPGGGAGRAGGGLHRGGGRRPLRAAGAQGAPGTATPPWTPGGWCPRRTCPPWPSPTPSWWPARRPCWPWRRRWATSASAPTSARPTSWPPSPPPRWPTGWRWPPPGR